MARVRERWPDINNAGPPPDLFTVLLKAYNILEQIHLALDEGAEEIRRSNGGRPICVEHCGLCCERNVPPAMQVEVMYYLSTLSTVPGGVGTVEKALEWLAQPAPGLSYDSTWLNRNLGPEERARLQAEQAKVSNGRCPFLGEDKRCTVHAARPLVCRAYGVTLAADSWCPRPLSGTETAERRKIIWEGSGLGEKIRALIIVLHEYLEKEAPNLASVGWFPTVMTRLMAPGHLKKLITEGKVPNVKLAQGKARPNLFRGVVSPLAIDVDSERVAPEVGPPRVHH